MRRFERRVEDFVCENCGAPAKGNGYTNHCPSCLHSKHVDINPGDRQSNCGGLMKPVSVEGSVKGQIIVHKCDVCGTVKRNKAAENDDFSAILEVARKSSLRGAIV